MNYHEHIEVRVRDLCNCKICRVFPSSRPKVSSIDGLRKAGDAPGHKIVVAVCVCVFVFVFVVVVVVVMLGSSLWGRK